MRRIFRTLRKTHSAGYPPTVIRGSGRGLYSPAWCYRLAGFEDIRSPVAWTYETVVSPVSLRLPTFLNAASSTERRPGQAAQPVSAYFEC